MFFVDLETERPPGVFAATENCPWRGRRLAGEVHDENAFLMNGVAGHAGMFGTADAVNRLLKTLLDAYHGTGDDAVFERDMVRRFLSDPDNIGRALGFDMPAITGSQAGRLFSRNTFGHLGFTGVSFWMDMDRDIIVVLLTNRVHPDRRNQAIRRFRPAFHDAVLKALAN